jgi:5'-3' exoribonuclease 1
MGIPSYFSYIIRNFPQIVSNIKCIDTIFHHLFLDCNSIIYDSVHKFEHTPTDQEIILAVITKINEYIVEVKPTKTVFVAFDGVAPFAKMNQQRTRRYKSDFMSNKFETKNEYWDTTKITPGTEFMKELSITISEYYKNITTSCPNIIVSTSNESGEGEHKIFQYIRDNTFKNDNVMIYGLDSDLFMLSIFHHEYYKNVFIFREAPDFLNSKLPLIIDNKNNCFLVDIGLLRTFILKEMGFSNQNRIYDYAFLCFFLGNDFLPHFPALNIRTHGIQALLDIYNQCFCNKPDIFLVTNKDGKFKINWKHVELMLNKLSKLEHDFLLKEYSIREKYDKWKWDVPTNSDEKEKMIQNIPIMYRMDEKYICPTENNWEYRYYNILFTDVSKNDKKSICVNYFEGLEWVLSYYTGVCVDWKWSYKYHYGPLFSDLLLYSPSKHKIRVSSIGKRDNPELESLFFERKNNKPVSQFVQLAYVLPKKKLHLLPEKMREYLLSNYSEFYPNEVQFQWAFTKYFWEAHVCFSHIPMSILDEWENVLSSGFIIEAE